MEEKVYMFISGPKLAVLREAKGLTQKELADKMAVSRATVVTWEGKDKLKFKSKDAPKLAEVIGVKVKDLTFEDGSTKPGGDILDHPLVKSFVEQINLQKEMIEYLKKENARLSGGKQH